MAPSIACLAGAAVSRMRQEGLTSGVEIGRPRTPFGRSETIHRIDADGTAFYLVTLCDAAGHHLHPGSINYRATLYALKDLGAQCVVGVSAVGSITHSFNVGDIVVIGDVIDRTRRRAGTFFERSGVGVLRQFPVFCPFLSGLMTDCLAATDATFHANSTLVVTEGPRLETPAEIRLLTAAGCELVGHYFAPEAFLAKELEMCFAGVGYVANYAETGSRHRPFSATDLFGGLTSSSEADRVDHAGRVITSLIKDVAGIVASRDRTCECDRTMRHAAAKFGLADDWRLWFAPEGNPTGNYMTVPHEAQHGLQASRATR